MLTLEHLEIYKKYNSNADAFVRCGTSKEKALMNNTLWALIDSLVQDLFLIKRGITSASFNNSVDEQMQKHCDNDSTIQALKNIVLAGI